MGIGALCNMEHRGATGAEADTATAQASSSRCPTAFLRAVAGFELPPPATTRSAWRSCPSDATDAEKAQASIEAIVADEGLRCSAGATCPPPRLPRQDRAA
jgi:glutamate synthase (NADPH/NADH) large chain